MKLKSAVATVPIIMLLASPVITPAAAPPVTVKPGVLVRCPARVETAIRAIPKYKDLSRPMLCRYKGDSVWPFGSFKRGHGYLGTAVVKQKYCTPYKYRCWIARVTAFLGHMK